MGIRRGPDNPGCSIVSQPFIIDLIGSVSSPPHSTFHAKMETMVASDIQQKTTGESPVLTSPGSRLRWYLYVAPLIVLPILLLVFAIVVVPTEWFAEHSGDPFLLTLGYGALLHNADCKIVIYGDSTAMIGVNPDLIAQRTGLTTCNIAETEGMSMVNGTMVLDRYLENNPRPRVLMFFYAPEDLDPQSQRRNTYVTTFEAVTWRFRQPHPLLSLVALMRHPDDFFSWAIHGARWAMDSIHAKPLPPETRLQRFKTHGQSFIKDPVMENCTLVPPPAAPDRAWVAGLRSKYAAPGSTVLVDAMTMPDCDPGIEYYKRELAGLIDNQINTLPANDFHAGGRHVTRAGSIPLSEEIADQVLKRLKAEHRTGVQ